MESETFAADSRYPLHVVIGYGPVGAHLVEALLRRGHRVRVVTRTLRPVPAPAEAITADMTVPALAARAVQGASVVYNAAQAPYNRWPTELPPLFRGILEAAERAGADLVIADNLYPYGPSASMPLRESAAYRPVGAKSETRDLLTREALAAHAAGRLRVAAAQASDFFGPRVLDSALGSHVFPPLLEGKAADVIGNPDMPHTYTYIKDFAEALAVLGTTGDGYGRTWHIPSAEAKTTREILTLAAQEAGTALRMRAMGRSALTVAGWFIPLLREMKETLYQFDRPFIVDSSDFQAKFAVSPTPLSQSLRETIQWFRSSAASPETTEQKVKGVLL